MLFSHSTYSTDFQELGALCTYFADYHNHGTSVQVDLSYPVAMIRCVLFSSRDRHHGTFRKYVHVRDMHESRYVLAF